MFDFKAMLATMLLAGLVGCGGSGGADQQDAGQHDAVAQHDAAAVGLAGTLTLNHAAIPDGVKGWVFVYDQVPGAGTPPVATMQVAASGAWSFPDVAAGSYYLLGGVDVNRSGEYDIPSSALADPFVIVGPEQSPAAGVVLDALTMWVFVGSVRVMGTHAEENQLYILRAGVLDPRNANAMTDATVVVSDGTAQFPLAFAGTTYEPAAPLDAIAVDGTYTFTVSHPMAYQTPLVVAIPHHPLQARPTIQAPTPEQHFGSVQDVQVTWQQAAGTTDSAIDVFDLAGVGTRVYTADAVTSPFTVPATSAGFTAGHTYRVSITDLRYAGNSGVVSIEAGASDVTISF